MGGRAIAKLINQEEAERITLDQKNEYLDFFSQVGGLVPVREIESKTDFGDIDFIYSSCKDDGFFEELIKTKYDYNGKTRNGNITSFAVGHNQIDIIRMTEAHRESALNYYNDNDKGNLIGVIFNRLGFIFGHTGLDLRLDFDRLFLSHDFGRILTFLKYSSANIQKMQNGFKTYEEMFETVMQTPYFDSSYYQFENLNNENRTRNRKRKTYQAFVEYLQDHPKKSLPFTKEKMMYDAIIHFSKEHEYIELMRKQAANQLHRQRFNGELISEITGFKRENLGRFIQFLKNEQIFLAEHSYYFSDEEMRERITQTYEKFISMNLLNTIL
jgi:hypothetical protein